MLKCWDFWVTYFLPYFILEAYQSSFLLKMKEGVGRFYAVTYYGMTHIIANTPVFMESRIIMKK